MVCGDDGFLNHLLTMFYALHQGFISTHISHISLLKTFPLNPLNSQLEVPAGFLAGKLLLPGDLTSIEGWPVDYSRSNWVL